MCPNCTSETFPFNHLTEDREFLNAVSDGTHDYHNLIDSLNEINFDPLHLNDNDGRQLDIDEANPDLHYYNDLVCVQNIQNCFYYLEESFAEKLRSLNVNMDCFSVIHFNIRSAPRNLERADQLLQTLTVDFTVIALTETWFNSVTSCLYCLPGYEIVSKSREGRIGGGVSLLIKNSFEYHLREDLSVFNECLESIFVEISGQPFSIEKDIIVAAIYRPPGTNMDNFISMLTDILNAIKNDNKLIYLCGDFNIDLLHSDTHLLTSNFIETMYSASLFPLITKPTRVTEHSATLIDNIFCNDIHDFHHFNGIFYADITDHYPIFSINYSNQITDQVPKVRHRIINKKNILKFQQKLACQYWNTIFEINCARISFNRFYQIYCDLFEECFPMKSVKLNYHNKKSWLTTSLKESIKIKNKLYAIYKKHPSGEAWERYRIYKSTLARILRKCEREYYDNLFKLHRNNLRKSWALIKQVINKNKQRQLSKQFKYNNHVIDDAKAIAEQFNNFFVNIGSRLASKIPISSTAPKSSICENNFTSIHITQATESEISNIILSLKNGSSGYDGTTAELLKQTFQSYLAPLTHICNLSLMQGYFPDQLKIARVTPIYKAGDAMLFNNYRPISVLPVFSKILEKLMFNRVMNYFNSRNILYPLQFGFRQQHTTSMAVTYLVDKIISAISNGEYLIGIFIDLSKAFDTVNHKILLDKMYKYGIRGVAYDWFASYLSNRYQFTVYNNECSSKQEITCGVPQGSILGPLLFITYINDLVSASGKITPLIYADDTSLYISGKDLKTLYNTANDELGNILDWMITNKLSVNIDKTSYIIFRPKRRHIDDNSYNLLLNNRHLKRVNSIKFLGVILDDVLSWAGQINNIKSKISKGIGIIAKARKYLNRNTLITLYYSFIFPHLIYCIDSWGCAHDVYLNSIFKLQKKALKIIKSVPKTYETIKLFNELKLLNIYQLYHYFVAIFMFKYKANLLPSIFHDFFNINTTVYNTRTQHLLHIPSCSSTQSQQRIRYKGVKVFNFLYERVNRNCSLNAYKHRLKTFLLDNIVIF